MPQDANSVLVLEILRQADTLKMGIFESSELAPTLRHYSQCRVSFPEIEKLNREILATLSGANKVGILEPGALSNLKKTAQLLWDHLFTGPVKNKLKASAGKGLVLCIDEELINIPWEILFTGDEFLCLKFNLGRLIRTAIQPQALEYRSLASRLRMLILANPTNDLKSAYLEGSYIKNQLDKKRSEIGVDFKSTDINTLYVKKNLRDYDLVHFAGHCEHSQDNPKNAGWLLSDGILTTQDIQTLGQALSLPSLVFSNACYSDSLASAFLFSGVRHYIGTVRRIEDPVSLIFANEFYAHLTCGKPIGECMRLARLRLIKEYGMASICWVSYLLYGDPGFVLFKPKLKPRAQKTGKKSPAFKNRLRRFSLAAGVVAVCAGIYLWLPTVNPDSYILFFKSRNLFARGEGREVISLCSRIIKKDPFFLDAYPMLADTYQRMGDKDNALKYYFEYAKYSQKRQDQKNLVSAYIGLGWVYHLYGEYQKAFDFYSKAAELSVNSKDKLNEARVLRKLAIWHTDKGENSRALELLIRSSEINRERQNIYGHKYNLACDYFDIGLVFINKQDYATAEEFYAKSRRLFEKLRLSNELSDCYFNLGEICLFEKEYHKAQDYYAKGLRIDQLQGNKLNLSGDYNMIGELCLAMDNLDEAEKYFNQAASLAREISSPLELAAACSNLGYLYKNKGRKNKAREYFRQAQEVYHSIDTSRYQEIKQELLALAD